MHFFKRSKTNHPPESLDQLNSDDTASQKHFAPKNKSFKPVLIAAVFLLVTGGAILVSRTSFYERLTRNELACSSRKDGAILNQAESVFKASIITTDQVETLVENVRSLNNYEKDANCLYPEMYLLTTNSYQVDSQELEQKFARFEKVYNNQEDDFASDIYPMADIEVLRGAVNFKIEFSNMGISAGSGGIGNSVTLENVEDFEGLENNE